jgi:tetratricopeptide (TPR) repeat protein
VEEAPAVEEEPPAAPEPPFTPEEITLSSKQVALTLDDVKATLDDLRAQTGALPLPPTAPPSPPAQDPAAPQEAEAVAEEPAVAPAEAPAAEEAPPVAPEEAVTISDESPFAAPEPPGPPPPDVSWLDAPTAEASEGEEAAEALFSDEEEFFDLASELEEELLQEETLLDQELHQPETEQSLEEIVEGFKEGMAETLSAEDYDTHYNLGVAYREMGLLDEAIGEFQLAAKDPRYLVECCSLLAACFREKGFPELALKWYQRALDSPNVTEDETLGLAYELADLHLAMGDTDAARERFVEIYGINSNYRDVVAKLEELGHS